MAPSSPPRSDVFLGGAKRFCTSVRAVETSSSPKAAEEWGAQPFAPPEKSRVGRSLATPRKIVRVTSMSKTNRSKQNDLLRSSPRPNTTPAPPTQPSPPTAGRDDVSGSSVGRSPDSSRSSEALAVAGLPTRAPLFLESALRVVFGSALRLRTKFWPGATGTARTSRLSSSRC